MPEELKNNNVIRPARLQASNASKVKNFPIASLAGLARFAGYMLISSDQLRERVGLAYTALRSCKLCPRNCGVDRIQGKTGVCHTGKTAKVASHNVHAGEEPPISGTRGSGTIFFGSCNLKCKFCQNYPISWLGNGSDAGPLVLAEMMLSLSARGCHNINIVTGSHVVPQFLAGFYLAKLNRRSVLYSPAVRQGRSSSIVFERSEAESRSGHMNLPIVWNSNGYDGMESLRLLDGVVDIYMPDIKYSSNDIAEHYSSAANYWDVVRLSVKEMYRQVGGLKLDENGIAKQGLIIRHLILPGKLSGTEEVLKFISEEISPKTHISFMSQYFPAHKAAEDPVINRRLTTEEYETACSLLERYGLENGWIQP